MRKVYESKIKKAWRGFSEMEKVIASSIENFLIGLKCLLVGNAPSNPIDLGEPGVFMRAVISASRGDLITVGRLSVRYLTNLGFIGVPYAEAGANTSLRGIG